MRRRSLLLFAVVALAACSDPDEPKKDFFESVKKLCSEGLQRDQKELIQAGRAMVRNVVADLCARPPCALGPIVDQALLGDVVQVLPGQLPSCVTDINAYLQVETVSGYRGYMHVKSLIPLPAGAASYRENGPLVRVTSRLANVYTQPSVTKGMPLYQIPVDISLRVVGSIDERWLKIVVPYNIEGYVQRGDVTEVPQQLPIPSAACVLEHARAYAGTPYLWGGRSTLGIDCSGLVSNSFIACGVVPPRDASPQFHWQQLSPVPKQVSLLRPGDLLFFGEKPETAAQKITHVGIYLGESRFIHATTHEHPMVQESLITDVHWTGVWVGARRYPFP